VLHLPCEATSDVLTTGGDVPVTITMLLILGGLAGLVVGVVLPTQRSGCIALLAVPVAMLVYIHRWQAAHPESLRSTSGLEYVFGPLWPSLGAIGGFVLGRMLRAALTKP